MPTNAPDYWAAANKAKLFRAAELIKRLAEYDGSGLSDKVGLPASPAASTAAAFRRLALPTHCMLLIVLLFVAQLSSAPFIAGQPTGPQAAGGRRTGRGQEGLHGRRPAVQLGCRSHRCRPRPAAPAGQSSTAAPTTAVGGGPEAADLGPQEEAGGFEPSGGGGSGGGSGGAAEHSPGRRETIEAAPGGDGPACNAHKPGPFLISCTSKLLTGLSARGCRRWRGAPGRWRRASSQAGGRTRR